MTATFRNLANKVTNMVEVDGEMFYSFDNGQFAYRVKEKTCGGDWTVVLRCCNDKGRSLANTGRFAEVVAAQHRAINRFHKGV